MMLIYLSNIDWVDLLIDDFEFNGFFEFGREVVCEMNWFGMFVDFFYVLFEMMYDVFDVIEVFVIFFYFLVFEVMWYLCNVFDDVLVCVKENGGVVMVIFVLIFVSELLWEWFEWW